MSQFNGLLRKYIDLVNENNQLLEKVTLNPDGTVPPTQTVNGVTSNAPTATAGTPPPPAVAAPAPAAAPAAAPAGPANPWAGKDPAKEAAWAKLSPEDQKWLGGADPTDKIILARAPSNGGFLGSLGFGKKPAAAPAAAAPAAAAPAAAAQAAAAPQTSMDTDNEAGTHAFDPTWGGTVATGGQTTAPNANATWNNATQTTVPNAPAAPAGQAAKPRIPAKSDPAVLKLQQGLIAKGAKIKADGVMGPATQAAMKQFGQGARPAPAPAAGYNPATTSPSGMDFSQVSGESIESNDHVMYNEDQALARIIQLARG